jgi:hypothetical protein
LTRCLRLVSERGEAKRYRGSGVPSAHQAIVSPSLRGKDPKPVVVWRMGSAGEGAALSQIAGKIGCRSTDAFKAMARKELGCNWSEFVAALESLPFNLESNHFYKEALISVGDRSAFR